MLTSAHEAAVATVLHLVDGELTDFVFVAATVAGVLALAGNLDSRSRVISTNISDTWTADHE